MGWAERMEKPSIHYDFEFLFLNGTKEWYCAVEGRDRISADDARIRLELHPDEQTVDEIIIQRQALASMRMTKHTIPPPSTTEDAGTLTLVGAVPEPA